MTRVFRGVLHAIVLIVALGATNARADIDASGNWLITVTDFGNTQLTQHWVQTGSVLSIDGNNGTINPQTGEFSVAFTPDVDPCSGGSEGGTVAPDGQSFSGYIGVCGDTPTLCCAGGGGGYAFSVVGSRIPCGDGIVEPGEQCDDGNLTPGDGCSPLCQIEPCHTCSGQPSACSTLPEGSACDDGNPCTHNACNASGTCVVTGSAPQGLPCDDGNICTVNACDGAGTCAVTNPAISCDDNNPCTLDQCDPSLGCIHGPVPFGTRCDPDPCTEALCSGVTCQAVGPIDCNDGNPCTVDSCDPQLGCQHASGVGPCCDDGNPCTVDSFDQSSGCVHTPDVRSCRSAQSNGLGVRTDSAHPRKDKLGWKWTKGEATSLSDFGMPAGTTSYTLCLFAGTGNAVFDHAEVPPSPAKWSALAGRGFKYKDAAGSADGIAKMTLVAGAAGKAKIIVKGEGGGLSLGSPPYGLPVTVQMTNSSTSACWASTFDAADIKRNALGRFEVTSKSR